jgi:hypothetical protein
MNDWLCQYFSAGREVQDFYKVNTRTLKTQGAAAGSE